MPQHRHGKKFSSNHTTLLDLSAVMVDIAAKYPEVRMITPGVVENGSGVKGGISRKVKFAWIKGGLLMTVRQSRSVQDVYVYTSDIQTTMVALARAARDREIPIGFLKKDKSQTY
jgi:hypothetical protein